MYEANDASEKDFVEEQLDGEVNEGTETEPETVELEESEKQDEEQTVEDTDADTRDIIEMLDGLISMVAALADTVKNGFGNTAALAIEEGATISQDTAIDDFDEPHEYTSLEELDYL